MTRLPRKLTKLTLINRNLSTLGLAIAAGIVGITVPASLSFAQAEPPAVPGTDPLPPAVPGADPAVPADPGAPADPAAPAAPAAVDANPNQSLVQNIDNSLHHLLVGNWPLAAGEVKQLAAREGNAELLQAVEKQFLKQANVDSPDVFLFRFREQPGMKEPIDALIAKLNQTRTQMVRDPAFIEKNIDNLVGLNERVRSEALSRLTQAGEIAVPKMVDRLRDTKYANQHPAILGALEKMRASAVNPLLSVLETRDEGVLLPIARVLLKLGYPTEVLPYIAKALEDPKLGAQAKARITAELAIGGVNAKDLRSGDLFYTLAERFYYNASAIKPDVRDPQAKVWFWTEGTGLSSREVPPPAFADVMAMRACENALRANTTQDAVSLWLAANNKREVDLNGQPGGQVYEDLDAHYWNVRLGALHTNKVLVRAMRDGDSQGLMTSTQRSAHTLIALKAIKSLAEIVGQSNMAGTPLTDAMRYSDRQVRYEAALALAGGLPQKPFEGQGRVVLLLAEALAQTGTSGVLVFSNTPAEVNAAASALKDKYRVAGGTNAAQVINESANLPSIDAILVSEDVNQAELQKLFATASQNARLDRAARVMMVRTGASPWFQVSVGDSRMNATTATTAAPAELEKAIEAGKAKAGGIPLTPEDATKYALRAADVLNKLAISRGQVLDIRPAEPTLLAALVDPRPELAKAAGGVLGLSDSERTQPALAERAIDDKTPDEVKVALYKALAANAKFYGNRLDEKKVDALRKAASNEKTPETKAAAAEALGALNLNVEQVKPLILDRPGLNPGAAPTP